MAQQDDREQLAFRRLLDDVLAGKLNRRQVMTRAAALGLSAASIHTLGLAAGATPVSYARPAAQEGEPTPGGRLVVGLLGDPANVDPHKESLTAKFHVTEHFYEGLYREAPDLTIQPLLAADMPTISEDGLTYTITLRDDVTFHNGRPLVAADVKYSYERIMLPENAPGSQALLASMASVEAPDDRTVVITLSRPDSSFLAGLAGRGAAIVAQEVVEENGGLDNVAVGTGPFIFVEYVPNTRVIVQKNPNYREAGKPYLDEIEFIPIPDDTQRTNALLTNTVDFIEYAPLQDIESLETNDQFTLAGETNTNIRYIHFNFSRGPLGDLRVRQAIAMALDRAQILEPAVYGHGLATEVIFPPDYWAYYEVPPTTRDIEGARALLAEAGYPDGFDIEIMSWAQYAFLNQAAYVVQAQLQEIGIRSEVVLEENAIFVERLYATADFDMAVTGTSAYIDPNDIIGRNFGTESPNNSMGYSNPRVDELIAQGIAETDQEARKAVYAELQQILYDEKPWIPLFIANQYEAMKSTVHGYVHIPTGTNYTLKDTWIEQ